MTHRPALRGRNRHSIGGVVLITTTRQSRGMHPTTKPPTSHGPAHPSPVLTDGAGAVPAWLTAPWPSRATRTQVATLTVAGIGALCLSGLPAGLLAGAMAAVSVSAVLGGPAQVDLRLRNVSFILIGVLLGSAATPETVASLPRWPISLSVLALCLVLLMTVVPAYLRRFGNLDPLTARLAAVPGALSYVLAVAQDAGADVRRVTILQSLRLSLLVFCVPFLAAPVVGDPGPMTDPRGGLMALGAGVVLVILCAGAGVLGARLRLPAAYLVAPMAVSCFAYASGMMSGQLPAWLSGGALIVTGASIGARFAGTDRAFLADTFKLGLVSMAIASLISLACAAPAAWLLDLPLIQVWLAFAPGGLDTMTVLAFALGIDPAFVAGHQLLRFLAISAVVPFLLRPVQPRTEPPGDGWRDR